jgi:hypothetical protein
MPNRAQQAKLRDRIYANARRQPTYQRAEQRGDMPDVSVVFDLHRGRPPRAYTRITARVPSWAGTPPQCGPILARVYVVRLTRRGHFRAWPTRAWEKAR